MYFFKELFTPYETQIKNTALDIIKSDRKIFRRESEKTANALDFSLLKARMPEIVDAYSHYGLKCEKAVAFVMYRRDDLKLHVDHDPLYSHGRVLLPIYNCQGTYTNFYSGCKVIMSEDDELRKKYTFRSQETQGRPFYAIEDPQNCVLAQQIELKQSTLINIRAPHDVTLPPGFTGPRVVLGLMFDRDPIFLFEQ